MNPHDIVAFKVCYWLHVAPNGEEQRFTTRPLNIPTLRVWIVGETEYTATFNFDRSIVEPRGQRWRQYEWVQDCLPDFVKLDSGPSTVWYRKAVRS